MRRAAARPRLEWSADEPFARRRELHVRASPVLQRHGYRGATLKALASACGLSIARLYRYFPSKKALALFPLVALYPELHAPAPDRLGGRPRDPHRRLDRCGRRRGAELHARGAAAARKAKLNDDEQRRMDACIAAHIVLVAEPIRRAAPHLTVARSRELASTMINVALAPAVTRIEPEPEALRWQFRALLRQPAAGPHSELFGELFVPR